MAKAEGLLHYEYLILKERAKNNIVKETMESELNSIHQEKEELFKDRERYGKLGAFERQI